MARMRGLVSNEPTYRNAKRFGQSVEMAKAGGQVSSALPMANSSWAHLN